MNSQKNLILLVVVLLVIFYLLQQSKKKDLEFFGILDYLSEKVDILKEKALQTFSGLVKNEMPAKVRSLLSKIGNQRVTRITVCRAPVQKALEVVLNAVSRGSFSTNKKAMGYDELYHLYMIVDYAVGSQASCLSGKCSAKAEQILGSNTRSVRPEKNAVVEMTEVDAKFKTSQAAYCGFVITDLPSDLTLNKMFEYAQKFYEAKVYRTPLEKEGFWQYDAGNNNCQVFIYNMLFGSGLLNKNSPSLKAREDAVKRTNFIMQKASQILAQSYKDKGIKASEFARFVTDLGALTEQLILQRL